MQPLIKLRRLGDSDMERRMRFAIMVGIVLAGLLGPAQAQTPPAVPETDLRELIEAARATAKATRENTDYARVTPDLLTQILAKLDKIEDKLGRLEDAVRRDGVPRRSAR
jgi:hypothetical protein